MRTMKAFALALAVLVGVAHAATPAPQSAEYKRGKALFAQCRACHQLKSDLEPNVGPNLAGVFGRKAGSGAGFSYSAALRAANFSWDAATMDRWLAKPSALVPGNVMAFAGMPDAAGRAALIAYLQTETNASK